MDDATHSGLSEDEKRVIARHDQYGIPDMHIGSDESLYHPWLGDVELKPMRFDLRNNIYTTILRAPGAAGLGRHRHRGQVMGWTLEGTWRYEEYDWVAKPGDLVEENPGCIHTLVTDTGCSVLFRVGGSLEFYDDDDNLMDIADTFSFLDLYIQHCEKNGIPVNEKLIF